MRSGRGASPAGDGSIRKEIRIQDLVERKGTTRRKYLIGQAGFGDRSFYRDGIDCVQFLMGENKMSRFGSAATVGEDRRPVGQARAVLLAAAGGKLFDAAAVWGDGATDRRPAGGDRP